MAKVAPDPVLPVHVGEPAQPAEPPGSDELETDEQLIETTPATTSERLAAWAANFLEFSAVQIASLVMTLVSLFILDMNSAMFSKAADNPVFVIMTVAFAFFVFELVLTMISVKRFYVDLFFWLDVIATLSIIPDVPWLWDAALMLFGQETGGQANAEVRAGGRVARVGARAARVVRVMRLLRLLRIFKLLRFFKKSKTAPAEGTGGEGAESALSIYIVPSNISSEISGTISRRVVLILLMVLIAANVFSSITEDNTADLVARLLKDAAIDSTDNSNTVRDHIQFAKPNLVYLSKTIEGSPKFGIFGAATYLQKEDTLRAAELSKMKFEEVHLDANETKFTAEMWLDVSRDTKDEAANTLLLLLCLVTILMTSNYVLSNDAIKIVGEPMERISRAQTATEALMKAFKVIGKEEQSLDDVKDVMVDTAHKVLDAEVVNLYLVDEAKQEFWCTHNAEDSSPFNTDIRVAIGQGTVGMLTARQGTVNERDVDVARADNDGSLHAPTSFKYPDGWRARDFVCVPILFRSKVVGALQVINKQEDSNQRKLRLKRGEPPFSQVDELMLEAFAIQIAPVLARRQQDVMYTNAVTQGDQGHQSMLAVFNNTDIETKQQKTARKRAPTFKLTAKTIAKFGFGESDQVSSIVGQPGLELPTLDDLKEWGYGCLDFNMEQLVGCTMMMLQAAGSEIAKVDMEKAANYIGEVFSRYNRVPYHNMYHAFNVVQGCFSLLQHDLLQDYPAEEKVAMLLAAAGHDAGHDGVNAAFHAGVESELSLHYNDKSILENMHSWHTFDSMRAQDGDCDLLCEMDPTIRTKLRHLMIDAIIATDMVYHKAKVDKLGTVEAFDMTEKKDRAFMMEIIVHSADIAHTTFSWLNECRWARLVATEFQAQVDRERACGLPPTVFMECSGEQQLGKGQLGFVDYVVRPLFSLLRDHVPEVELCLKNLTENRAKWAAVGDGTGVMLGNDNGEDDDLMSWSCNVGCLAMEGNDSEVMKQAKPVTVLMTAAGKEAPLKQGKFIRSKLLGAKAPVVGPPTQVGLQRQSPQP